MPLILLTNDAANRALAVAEGLTALDVMAYCREHRADDKELQVRGWGRGGGSARLRKRQGRGP